ncbi:hypothetical protein [Cellulomonas sp.]|uniref:hypothetical protein n=1 Tax=Cellulomonas sp. TaxID=40001 RepID=UPI002D491867|nr:hypothetical protein [Cellulomonas sp.]HYQ74890.1 hypothetical protein [Cellulomonas sp.]
MGSRRSSVLAVLVACVLGGAVGAAVARWVFHEDATSAWVIAGTAALAAGIGDALSGPLQRRRAATGARTGRFEGSVRSASAGGGTGLGPRWVGARLDVDDTGVTVVRLVAGMRPLRRQPVRLAVDGVRRTGRRTGRGDVLRVAPGLEILAVDAPGGTVEVAVEAPSADHLVERLAAIGGPRATP